MIDKLIPQEKTTAPSCKLEVLTTVLLKIQFFLDVTL
jgi:hypothetical protein